MEERYEIKDNVDEASLEEVSGAQDLRANREVATTRNAANTDDMANTDDTASSEEGTRHLMQETDAPDTPSLPDPNPVVTQEDVPTLKIAKPASAILRRAVVPNTPSAGITISKPKLIPAAKLSPSPVSASKLTEVSTPVLTAATPKKKGLSNGVKTMTAAVLGILAVVLAVFLLKKSGQNAENKLYNEMITLVEKDAKEVPVDKRRLEILLRTATDVGANDKRVATYTALFLAKSTDGTDVDACIAAVATTQEMVPNIRIVLLRDVLRKRNNPAIIGTLMKFARSTKDVQASEAAIQATRFMADDSHFAELLDVIKSTKEMVIITAAEENAAKIIEKSKSKEVLGTAVSTAYDSAPNDLARHIMLRLFGRIGGDKALELVQENLNSAEIKDKIAALVALGAWGDRSGYTTLIGFLKTASDLDIRARAFKSAFDYAARSESQIQENWTLLAAESKTQPDQLTLIRGLVSVKPAPWVYAIIQQFADSSQYEEVKDLALRAIDKLKDIESVQGGGEDEE